ncbi:MAG: hypothetical protein IPP64_02135 [Bacteroidetes bacterium]|nr:hypothetical protein [Bacteroidota bacterium]
MRSIRTIAVIVCALLVFFTSTGTKITPQSFAVAEVNQPMASLDVDPASEQEQSLTAIKELSGCIIKGNEGRNFGFQNQHSFKKHLTTNLARVSSQSLSVFYPVYCQSLTNSFNSSPFYIAYHRLII